MRMTVGCNVALKLSIATLLAVGPACSPRPPRPNVVIVVIDTLRPDALGAYGNPDANTPHFDRLAAEGTLFAAAWATAPWTIPSVSSLLTSRYPSEHGEGAQRAADAPDTVPTLAEVLRNAGWRTAAFVEADWPLLHRGFETFEIPAGDLQTRITSPSRNGATITFGRAIEWLASTAEPFFVLVHTYEAHDYFVGKDYQRDFAAARFPAYRGRFVDWGLRDANADLGPLLIDELLAATPDDTAFVRARYAAGVAAVDAEFGQLDAALARHGLHGRTLVIATGDHGEGFAPGLRRVHHGGRLHDDLLGVPLLLRWPGHVPVARESRRVSVLDVMPTVLGAAGVAPPPFLRGRLLLERTRGLGFVAGTAFRIEVHSRPTIAEESTFLIDGAGRRHLSSVRQSAIAARGLKLITSRDRRELYAIREDPEERANLASSRPDDVEMLERMLRRRLPPVADETSPMRPETAEQLRALGYLR